MIKDRISVLSGGIVDMPEKHKWSSYQYYVGRKKKPDRLKTEFILEYFGSGLLSQKNYANFVLVKINGKYESPLKATIASTILGDDSFIERITEKYLKNKDGDRNLPALREIKKVGNIDSIYKEVRVQLNNQDAIVKKAAIYLCHRKRGNPLKEIGDYFGISESGVSLASSRFSQTLKRNRKLRKMIEQVQKELDL